MSHLIGLTRYRPNRGSQLLGMSRTGLGIDDDHAGIGHHETCVGLPFRAPAGVPHSRIDSGSEAPDSRRPVNAGSPERVNGENENWTRGEKGTQHR